MQCIVIQKHDLFVCLEFNAAFNSFGHITAVSAPTNAELDQQE